MAEHTITNKEIIKIIDLYAKLLELHDENPFKIKSFKNASFTLSKLSLELHLADEETLVEIKGVGKSLASKIVELNKTGSIVELEKLISATPIGVLDILKIKGLGPSKVRSIWKDLEITSLGELLYACYENRLSSLKGFGQKTQETVIQNIEFLLKNAGSYLISEAKALADYISENTSDKENYHFTGEYLRSLPVLSSLDILVVENSIAANQLLKIKELTDEKGGIPLNIISSKKEDFNYQLLKTSSDEVFLQKINFDKLNQQNFDSENQIFESLQIPYIIPERREAYYELEEIKKLTSPSVEIGDIKGLIHLHTQYSDGQNTIEEMLLAAKEKGYQYMGVTDHSKSAFYANGLSEERIFLQHQEIDKINNKHPDFKVLKGIESDILSDGNLDYSDDILKTFDFVIASIHSNLNMDESKAKMRLTKAIENPFTNILGHPTGRLLLSRKGYPVDFEYIIDACSKNNVSIELNANPYRLDMDWKYINLAIDKGVKISINPDAHVIRGIDDNYYGIAVARKSLLQKEQLLNNLTVNQLIQYFKK
jgi:DNA polymerase (family X)